MKQNKFDLVMDYIDANINQDTETLKRGIYNLINYNSKTFDDCFKVLTNITLFHYISERRMYFASRELQENFEKPICDIALDYGYSDQTAFTRAMKTFYKCTPNDVRKGKNSIPNNKYLLKDFNDESEDTLMQKIYRAFENDEFIPSYNMELLFRVENAAEEYNFDFDTCCQIVDLAEKLEISPLRFLDKCYAAVLEEEFYNDEFCAEWKISEEELKEICNHFDCKHYDLDLGMVLAYRGEI